MKFVQQLTPPALAASLARLGHSLLLASFLLVLQAPAGAQESVDILLHNGKVFTADDLTSFH